MDAAVSRSAVGLRAPPILDFPEKRNNLCVTGLRGVGKTVLLKEYERTARDQGWAVVRSDLYPRLCQEDDFGVFVAERMGEALEQLSVGQRAKAKVKAAGAAIGQIGLQLEGVTVTLSTGEGPRRVLEDRLRTALVKVGEVAGEGRGAIFLFDEAHVLEDVGRGGRRQYALGSLLSAIVAVQDREDPPLPVMLVLCGLPSLTGNIHRARSNAERLLRAQAVANLRVEPLGESPSEAALALLKPAEEQGATDLTREVADAIARDVDGYPYFLQKFGEGLWDAADLQGHRVIDVGFYADQRSPLRKQLDEDFFDPRFRDARRGDQGTLRVAAALGGETFTKSALDAASSKTVGALSQSLNRLVAGNLVFRDAHGVYRYTAPRFGDFLRRRHPRLDDDV